MAQFTGYLDAAASAPLRAEARAAMLAVLDDGPGNPSSVHSFGHRAEVHLSASRRAIAEAFGARESEIIFTSGGTEANNLAVIGLALANPRGRHILTTPLEHSSVLEACNMLERVFGFEVQQLPVDETGSFSAAAVRALLRSDTTLLTLGLANAEIGTVQAVADVIDMAQQSGALVHTDAVQAAASLPVSFAPDGWPGAVDAMTIASHKFGGPQGVGALLLRAGTVIEPLLHGGGQEFGYRSGTQNVAGIAGFAAAVRAANARVGTQALALANSRDELLTRILTEVPGAALTGHATERLPGHASVVVAGVSGESLLVALDAAGVAASSGSACAAGNDEPSPVLLALGLSAELAQTALRFTLFAPLSDELIDRIVGVLVAEVSGRA